MATPNDEAKRLIETSGRTQQEVANYLERRLGRSFKHYHVSRMVNGERKVAADEMDALRELSEGVAEGPSASIPLTDSGEMVPLFGYANAAGGVLRLSEDQRVGVVSIHPAQRGSRHSFAVLVFGDSMADRLYHGETAYAVRNKPPIKGDVALIEKVDGETLIKFYEGQDNQTLFLRQLNPKQDLRIPLRDVRAIHAVVGSAFGRN